MFPWVYGFEWTPGHLIFLGVFFTVLLVVASTLIIVLAKSLWHFKEGRAHSIQWRSLFHDLPGSSRACRHAITGEMPGRVCELGFDCRECLTHGKLLAGTRRESPACGTEEVLGMQIPLDRFYHRGHCWVKPVDKTTVLVGLDELGRRLMGRPKEIALPAPGSTIVTNTPAFEAERNGSTVRVLAPVDGEVIATGGPADDWILKLRVEAPLNTRHLLFGREVKEWYHREIERLQILAGQADGAPALADGGELADDLAPAFGPRWGAVCGEMLLDP